MSINGGDPRTHKKVRDDSNTTNHQHGFSSSSNQYASNTNGFTNQTSSSTSYNYSSSNMINTTDSFNRSSNNHGQSS